MERLATVDGLKLALHDFGGPAGAPVLLWAPANGFASLSYPGLLSRLAMFVHVFALDPRAHGESDVPGSRWELAMTLPVLARDYAMAVRHVAARAPDRPVIGAGHSLGALLPLLAAIEGEVRLDGLVLVEAAVFPPSRHAVHDEAATLNAERQAAIPRRRREFDDPEHLARSLAKAPAFANLAPEAMRAHCSAVLRPAATNGWTLRCPPEIEGLLYGEVQRASPYNALRDPGIATLVVGADPGAPGSSWVAKMQDDVAARLGAGSAIRVPGAGHLVPLEAPEACAEAVRTWIESWER